MLLMTLLVSGRATDKPVLVNSDGDKKEIMLAAMTYISARTCIKFTPDYDPDDSFILMGSDGGCYTKTGKEPYPGQFLSLGQNCRVVGTPEDMA